ncbi:hypothetical protein ACQEVM_37830 [Streptomyces sp. CA-243310]|uniref:hypothetical protein n=1 Tax=Streptomyces sp. CA-243310 TaxID=3240056 RepID=UPI003D8FD1A1
MGVALVGGLPVEGFGAFPVPGLLPHLGKGVQGSDVASVAGLSVQGFGALPVPGPLLNIGKVAQDVGVAEVGGAVEEVVSPLQAVAFKGFAGEAAQVVGVGDVGVGGVPKRCGWAEVRAGGAAVLFQVVGEPETRALTMPVPGDVWRGRRWGWVGVVRGGGWCGVGGLVCRGRCSASSA